MNISGIVDNLIADVIFLAALAVIGWLWVTLTRRRALQQFFGVDESKRIVIYLSNLRIRTFGAIGISGREMSYRGSAVAAGEMRAAQRFKDLFAFFIPALSESSNFLTKLLISDVSATLLVSPIEEGDLESQSTFVALGSSAYNIASKHIEGITDSARFRYGVLHRADVDDNAFTFGPTSFSTNAEAVITQIGLGAPQSASTLGNPESSSEPESETSAIVIQGIPPLKDALSAFVLRVFDEQHKRIVFYVAGLSEHATEGAANYLISEWSQLHRWYPPSVPFLVVLKIADERNNKWSVIFHKQLDGDSDG